MKLSLWEAASALLPLPAGRSSGRPVALNPSESTSPKTSFRRRTSSFLASAISTESLPFILLDVERSGLNASLRGAVAGLLSAALYAFIAIGCNFQNKMTLSVYPYANTLLLLQMLTVLAIILPLRAFGAVSFPPLSAAKARSLLPITVLYASNVSCALLGLRLLNVPMYSTLKRLTPMMVLLTKWRMTRAVPSRGVAGSVALVVIGCFIAGAGDLSFDLRGYAFALASCGLQAAYLLLVEFSGAKQGVTTSELLTYNAVLSLPFIAAVVVLSGEGFAAVPALGAAMAAHGTWRIVALLGMCSISGVALNFSMFLCTSINSALTTTIVGALKGVVATGLGFVLLGGVEPHALNVAGIVLNAVGGVTYSAVKYKERSRKAALSSRSSLDVSPLGSPVTSSTPTKESQRTIQVAALHFEEPQHLKVQIGQPLLLPSALAATGYKTPSPMLGPRAPGTPLYSSADEPAPWVARRAPTPASRMRAGHLLPPLTGAGRGWGEPMRTDISCGGS
jgi:solute carrier family 35 protein